MRLECTISKEQTVDVIVVGGGTAGVFAAISAAKSGVKTLLIEKNSTLGGTVTVAGVNYPGLFFAWGKQIIGGPSWEAIERTVALGGATLPSISYHPEHHWEEQILLNPFVYTTVLFQMCEEAGVEVLCSAMPSYVEETEEGVRLVVTEKGGMRYVQAGAAIDATGDANLCQLLGYEVAKSATQQPATLKNHLCGYTFDEELAERVRQRFDPKRLPPQIEASDLVHYLRRGKIGMHIPCEDADSSEGKTSLERRALYDIMKVYRFLREIEGLEHLTVDQLCLETGVRETNRIVGVHCVSAEEYIRGEDYEDSVCYAFYPIDLHVSRGIEQTFHEEDVVSKVPYRALIPQRAHRVLCAGRCISSDTYANSALRVEAVCMAVGQAAGCAASLMVKRGIAARAVPYDALADGLRALGCIVPEREEN